MQSWGEVLLMVDCYKEDIRRIENKYAGKVHPFVRNEPPHVIRLIKRLVAKSKAAVM